MDVNTTDIKVSKSKKQEVTERNSAVTCFFKLNLVLGIYSKSYIKNIKY